MDLIPNYQIGGFTGNGNVVLATRNDSTTRNRRDATYSRRVPSFNNGTKVFSIPEDTFVVRRDVPDADQNPSGQRIALQFTARIPVASLEADISTALEDFRAYINQVDLLEHLIRQDLPTCCAPVE